MKKYMALLVALSFTAANAQWTYEGNVDKMSGKKSSTASVTSDNQLSFDFPYKGKNSGFLTIRQHPQYGLDVIVSISKGQMLCHTYDCTISVKFDDGKPVKYSGTGPADHSSTSIFIENAPKFIAGAKKAKKILIQFNAYQNGAPILEFTTPQPLEWPRK
jgi:hypothetical protein